jgi:hypothetical protein
MSILAALEDDPFNPLDGIDGILREWWLKKARIRVSPRSNDPYWWNRRNVRRGHPHGWRKPALRRHGNNEQCPCCGKWCAVGKVLRLVQRTSYQNEEDNYFTGCRVCRKENDDHWDSMWEDYYRECC